MANFRSFRDVIGLWPSLEDLAADVSVRKPAVTKWRQRNRIPAEKWSAILSTEKARSGGVTSETLVALAAREEARTCAGK
jgi:DNA-binding transcriptional regulator YdaS (Cro superfamily)